MLTQSLGLQFVERRHDPLRPNRDAALAAFAGVYRRAAKPRRKRRNDVSEGPSEDCSGTESAVGEGQSQTEELKAKRLCAQVNRKFAVQAGRSAVRVPPRHHPC
jgi:hypothetical protein